MIEALAKATTGFNAMDLHLLVFETIRQHSFNTLQMIEGCENKLKIVSQQEVEDIFPTQSITANSDRTL